METLLPVNRRLSDYFVVESSSLLLSSSGWFCFCSCFDRLFIGPLFQWWRRIPFLPLLLEHFHTMRVLSMSSISSVFLLHVSLIHTLFVISDILHQNETNNFKSSKTMEELAVMVPNLMDERAWPNDIFNTLAYYVVGGNYLRFSTTTIWIVYRGNDTTKPVLSEVNISTGDNVHKIVTQFCDESGFSNDPYESTACHGVGVRDAISNIVYGVAYTSTRSTATLKDYIYKRSNVISTIIDLFQYHHYLEIGCDDGKSFNQVKNSTTSLITATCVDPNLESIATHHLTSDDFFASLEPDINIPTTAGPNHSPILHRYDIVFVDGLHEANQAYRDTMHALRVLIPGGTILMHDSNPPHEYTAMFPIPKECYSFNWHGDVWKTVVALRLSSDLEVVTLDMDCGIAVVRKRPNHHPLSNEWKEFLGPNPMSMLRWEHLRDHRDELMRLVSLTELIQWLNEETMGFSPVVDDREEVREIDARGAS